MKIEFTTRQILHMMTLAFKEGVKLDSNSEDATMPHTLNGRAETVAMNILMQYLREDDHSLQT